MMEHDTDTLIGGCESVSNITEQMLLTVTSPEPAPLLYAQLQGQHTMSQSDRYSAREHHSECFPVQNIPDICETFHNIIPSANQSGTHPVGRGRGSSNFSSKTRITPTTDGYHKLKSISEKNNLSNLSEFGVGEFKISTDNVADIALRDIEKPEQHIPDEQRCHEVNSVDVAQTSVSPEMPKVEKRRRIALSAGKKKEVCQYKVDNNKSTCEDISAHFSKLWNFSFSASTVCHILRVKEKWLAVPDESYNIIRNRRPKHQELDDALYNWFTNSTNPGITISDETFLNKAHEFGKELNITGLSYSTGWLYRFKRRHGICNTKQQGKNESKLYPVPQNANHKMKAPAAKNDLDIEKSLESRCDEYVQSSSHGYEKFIESINSETNCFVDSYNHDEYKVDITLEEAHKGLVNVMKFLEVNPSLGENYMEMLQKLLQSILLQLNKESETIDELKIIKGEVMTDLDDDNLGEEDRMIDIACENPEKDKNVEDQLLSAKASTDEKNMSTFEPQSLSRCHRCNTCGKGFLRSGDLQRHKVIHTGKKPHKCTVCDRCFADPNNLRTHMRIHTGERPFVCSTCGKSCTTHGNLQMHMRFHTGEKPYICSVCNKRFAQSCNLTEHVRIHTGERPYKCKTCEKNFTRSGDLRSHQRLHTGEKPYICSVCNRSFTQWSNLHKHKKSHTGEKPYKCVTCGRYFADKCVLVTHQRTHTGERPFCCDVCGKTFSNSGSLHHHGKTHANQHNSRSQP